MSVSNEVVKFITEIELDAQDKAAFTKALKDANDECATFRKEIARTETEMAKLAAGARQDLTALRPHPAPLPRGHIKAITDVLRTSCL